MIDVVLLAAGIIGALAAGGRVPRAVPPAAMVVVALALQRVTFSGASGAVRPLLAALAFLLCAVPLAVLLDDAGCFAAAASLGGGVGALWVTASLAVAVLNLDAAVVLITPLAVHLARRRGADPRAYALVPALVASLASSALPVSNLTNLVVIDRIHASTLDYLRELGPSTLAALVVGYVCFLRSRRGSAAPTGHDTGRERTDRGALTLGLVVVTALVVLFAVGVPPWIAALAATGVLSAARRRVPWRTVPVATAVLAASLAVLAASAVRHLPADALVRGGDLRRVGTFAVAANLVNNLPAVLLARPHLHAGDGRVWSILLGVNVGPVVLLTASLSNLLWLESARRAGVRVGGRDFSIAGLRVGVPALAAAAAVLLLVRR